MKTKHFIGIVTTILIVGYMLSIVLISTIKKETVDISSINDLVKNIQYQLENDTLPNYDKSEYSVIMLSDNNYQSTVHQAIRQNSIAVDLMVEGVIVGKAIFPSQDKSLSLIKEKLRIVISIAFLSIAVLSFFLLVIINAKILKPFRAMETFAGKVAKGDFDFSLDMPRDNYFGAFTESFDLMREELKRAKEGEYQANLSKKELVASLSHDIKTPVATVKAYCEVLQIKLKNDPNVDKISIIYNNADVIDKLISNMFHAALEELQILKIEATEELSSILPCMFQDINHYDKIIAKNNIPDCLIYCDKLRIGQVIHNIINNSYKYADTDIFVTYSLQEDFLNIEIRDEGKGVPEEDLPLIFEKYYRGMNAKNNNGAGLGLFLSKQFMEGMMGLIEGYNDNGFVVVLHIKIV